MSIAGRLKHFLKAWHILTESGNFCYCEGFSNPLFMSTSLKGNSNENKLQPKRAKGNLIRDRKLFEEGCNRTSLCNITTAESICEQHFSGKEKRWGKRPVMISNDSHTGGRILGYGNRLKGNYFIITRESSVDQIEMPESSCTI